MWENSKDLIRPFVCSVEISKAACEELPDGTRLVRGPVGATDQKDYDGETLTKASLWKGLEMHERLKGHVDYEHKYDATQDPDFLIGKRKSVENRDGAPFMVTELYKGHPLSDKVWSAIQRGVPMGYSISGFATKRDSKDNKKILATEIHRVTITASPKGFEGTTLEVVPSMGTLAKALVDEFEADNQPDLWIEKGAAPERLRRIEAQLDLITKALTTGSGIVEAGEGGGAALRTQYMDGDGPGKTEEKPVDKKCNRCKRKMKSGTKSKFCFQCAAKMHSATYDAPMDKSAGKFSAAINKALER